MSSGGDEEQQGFSIWIFIIGFTALAVIGLIVVVIIGSPTSDSKPGRTVSPATSSGVEWDHNDGSGDPTATTTTSSVTDVTLPDGSPAPAGASAVTFDDGVLTVTFSVNRSDLSSTLLPKVPPIDVTADAESTGLRLSIGCSSSSREQLSQVIITETVESVRVSAVVLVPTNATGCNPNHVPLQMALPLSTPLGERTIRIESQDLDLPPVDIDSIDD